MFTVFPIRPGDTDGGVDRRVAGRGMVLAPFVGVILGLVPAAVLVTVHWLSGSALLAAVLAVGTLAWLTRGLHLDGLADLADGLGSGKPATAALDIMKRSDIGPFGVVTLVFTLLSQIAALSAAPALAPAALVAACATGRLAVTWACRDGVPAARPGGLGALVAGTVRRSRAITATALAALAVALLGSATALWALQPWPGGGRTSLPISTQDNVHLPGRSLIGGLDVTPAGTFLSTSLSTPLSTVLVLLLAMAAGLGAAALVRRRAVRRLGGITGDVLGALVETATTAALLVCALL
ncbi:adenosylcobinamide-GDP ribazoletransferase [Planotetraspora sp. A-T 1434]|nr:adenosylcobinamide-GDP ribazoletransferase [Planotetraspora sp. A-T 1434]